MEKTSTTLLALFGNIETAAKATDTLSEHGIEDHDIEVITGSPINPEMLGRHHKHTNVPKFALVGAVSGAIIGALLAFVTPRMYELYVGGKPLSPGAPSVVVIFEMIMLLMLIFTFVGVFLESGYPSLKEKAYHPEISDGDIAFLFDCSSDSQTELIPALKEVGAKTVREIDERNQEETDA
jgi:hypothetical protein